jgi:hypothetical protein
MHKKNKAAITVVTPWAILLGFMVLSQPQKLPVLLLIVPFILLLIALMNTWKVAVPLLYRLVGKRGRVSTARLRVAACGSVVLLLVLQSLGQLTLRDVLTILAIIVIGYVYSGRSRPEQQGK